VRFEWDPEKDAGNQRKHDGIGFAVAALVFNDPDVRFRRDRVVDGEQRWHAIGVVEKAVLLVVHVYREENENGEEIIRIISARRANQRERRIYIQQAGE
jgi:uncharacterized DUF497 family protein